MYLKNSYLLMKACLLRMKTCVLNRFMYNIEPGKSLIKMICGQCNLPWVKRAGGDGIDFF